jgi:hypothetical protein
VGVVRTEMEGGLRARFTPAQSAPRPRVHACVPAGVRASVRPLGMGEGTRRVRLVPGRDAACPFSTGGGRGCTGDPP